MRKDLESLQEYTKRGVDALNRGKYEEALKILSEASNLGDSRAQLYLADLYDEGKGVRKDVDKAIHILSQCVAHETDRLTTEIAFNNMGIMHLQRGEYALAMYCLQEAIKRGAISARLFLAECYFHALMYKESRDELNKFLKKSGKPERVFKNRVEILKSKLSDMV